MRENSKLESTVTETAPSKLKKSKHANKEDQTPAIFDTSLDNEKLTINLSYSHYPVVEEVAKNSFNYRVSKIPDNNWDILWSDTVH